MKSGLCFTIKTDYLDAKQWEELKMLQHPDALNSSKCIIVGR